MAEGNRSRKAIFWRAQGSSDSVVERDFAKLPKEMKADLAEKVDAFTRSPESVTSPKPLRHVGRIAEYSYRGPHGHGRALLIDMTDYVLILDVYKKQGNKTSTGLAVRRLKDWNSWH